MGTTVIGTTVAYMTYMEPWLEARATIIDSYMPVHTDDDGTVVQHPKYTVYVAKPEDTDIDELVHIINNGLYWLEIEPEDGTVMSEAEQGEYEGYAAGYAQGYLDGLYINPEG